MTTMDRVFALSRLTTKDEAGQHFTQRYDDETLADLESAGLIKIHRPIHDQTGLSYNQELWSVEVTAEGCDLVGANPEYWDTDVNG